MTRPRLLDLFCCEGGASTGYHRAGFDVYGVDVDPQPRYPFSFARCDALEVLTELLGGRMVSFQEPGSTPAMALTLALDDFDAIHASPPCQGYSTITPDKSQHPLLIEPVRELLLATGKPYVIENVEGARSELVDPLKLCGSSFALAVRRHRLFESNVFLMGPPCQHGTQRGEYWTGWRPNGEHRTSDVVQVYGNAGGREEWPAALGVVGIDGDHPDSREFLRPDGTRRSAKATSNEQAASALGGASWMSWHGMTECIPPAYTEHIGTQLLETLR